MTIDNNQAVIQLYMNVIATHLTTHDYWDDSGSVYERIHNLEDTIEV